MSFDPTIGGAAANSYSTVEDADAYFATRLFSDAWNSLTGAPGTATKQAALVTATKRIEQIGMVGTPTSPQQALHWPCSDYYDPEFGRWYPDDELPTELCYAVYETALALLTAGTDSSAKNALAQFSSLRVPGGLEIVLREGFESNDWLPPVVWRLLAKLTDGGVTYLERA